jgi:hypothetical protein
MGRQGTEPLTPEQAKARLRQVMLRVHLPWAAVALVTGLLLGMSPSLRAGLLTGAKLLIRAREDLEKAGEQRG